MKKLLVVLGVLVLMSSAAFARGPVSGDGSGPASAGIINAVLSEGIKSGYDFAETTGGYYVDYYSNNGVAGAEAADQVIRIINVGVNGTPLTSPAGDICANIYAFDNQQEMVTCCSCRITPNEFAQAYVNAQLVNIAITVTPVQPVFGVIKVATTPAGTTCNPTAPLTGADASLAQVFGTHKQVTGGATFVTEAEKLPSPLSTAEADFLPLSCTFARYLGSGFGVCRCGAIPPPA